MFHSGDLHHCCKKELRDTNRMPCSECFIDKHSELSEPKMFDGAIKRFKSVSFVVAHLGNPFFQQTIDLIKKYDNVFVDTSGQITSSKENFPKEKFNKAVNSILNIPNGCDKIIFGTDFPIQSYEDSLASIKDLNLDKDVQDKILFKNAAKLLRLKI